MIELKEHFFCDIDEVFPRGYLGPLPSKEMRPYYIKSEADKVIAELKEKHKTEVKELLCLIRDMENNFNRAFDSEEKELRSQKYKRCMDNAWWCLREEFYAEDCHCERWVDWAIKWYKRWLELAEKFKDGK